MIWDYAIFPGKRPDFYPHLDFAGFLDKIMVGVKKQKQNQIFIRKCPPEASDYQGFRGQGRERIIPDRGRKLDIIIKKSVNFFLIEKE